MAKAEVWIVGDWRHEHFAAPVAWLRERADCQSFSDVNAILSAAGTCQRHRDPSALLLVQSRPGQISNREVERLHSAAPLARLVGLLGPWCEGEGRSGRPWAGIVRVPWRNWRWRLPRELGLSFAQPSLELRLPRAATENDRLQRDIFNLAQFGRFLASADVLTTSRTTFESWRDLLSRLGVDSSCPALGHMPTRSTDFQVIDGWENVPQKPSLAEGPPRIVSLHFPRPEDVNRATTIGVRAVLAQPLLLADMAVALNDVLPASARRWREPAA
jgi:hypothetical protein